MYSNQYKVCLCGVKTEVGILVGRVIHSLVLQFMRMENMNLPKKKEPL